MKKPFFSIIIPTYNRAHLIHIPIESILHQTYDDWELIIIDDGSTDNTREIVEAYQDSRIHYVWQENRKESAARNHGISIAQGEWLCFQDSDDEYLSNHLEVLHEGIKNYPEYKCIKSGLIIHQDSKEIHRTDTKPLSRYDTFPYEAFTTAAFHCSIFPEIKFDERFHASEDLHFILQVGKQYQLKTLNSWTGITHFNPDNSSRIGRYYEERIINRRACLKDILSWNTTLIQPYLKRELCRGEMLLFSGHLKYRKQSLFKAFFNNLSMFLRFPVEYLRLLISIVLDKTKRQKNRHQNDTND